ncbi:hypothetical protein [Planktothricoides raciborskii]|uniref:hypothetical protein n=1 Tax=Planktothricoides raciborskii TaxID=132608 RepID=UPI001F54DAEB|nr:hypothetical protein [Planktothricoides raciborskii]
MIVISGIIDALAILIAFSIPLFDIPRKIPTKFPIKEQSQAIIFFQTLLSRISDATIIISDATIVKDAVPSKRSRAVPGIVKAATSSLSKAKPIFDRTKTNAKAIKISVLPRIKAIKSALKPKSLT